MTCFLIERKKRNKPFNDDDCVVFDLSNLSKRVLRNSRPVCDDDGDDDENDDFQWFLNLKKSFKTRLKSVKSVINNF